MAYVPPHRRVQASSSSETIPRSTERLYDHPREDDDEGSTVFIWFAVDANANLPPNLKFEFKPFGETSFLHLRDTKVYTISVQSHPVDDATNDMRSLMNNESPPWRYTSNKIKDDLRKCFHKLEKYVKMSKPNYAKPSFTARFGKIIFHGYGLESHKSVTLDILEKTFHIERHFQTPSKIFYTNIPKDIFEAVKQKAIMSLASPTLKEKVVYLILVRNVSDRSIGMEVTCHKKDIDGKQIEVKKAIQEVGNGKESKKGGGAICAESIGFIAEGVREARKRNMPTAEDPVKVKKANLETSSIKSRQSKRIAPSFGSAKPSSSVKFEAKSFGKGEKRKKDKDDEEIESNEVVKKIKSKGIKGSKVSKDKPSDREKAHKKMKLDPSGMSIEDVEKSLTV
ncbi:uncharacterized protein LOC131859183 [Cryptomeria japonica]|uniref:uncharacterized protein LOC131859183 n=1 Tax=Cryptomeria japonica TaxID=3369 RepID=UPI0027DA3282|nr:uncharacterized protein LOC131859183 [Cryptomeria japonica]